MNDLYSPGACLSAPGAGAAPRQKVLLELQGVIAALTGGEMSHSTDPDSDAHAVTAGTLLSKGVARAGSWPSAPLPAEASLLGEEQGPGHPRAGVPPPPAVQGSPGPDTLASRPLF